ncbi:hypothetical protein B6J41_25805, partial [Klebsiella pneumoniae]
LLNDVCRLAVENLLYAARKRGLEPGIFCAIHTYGRRLNWHPHEPRQPGGCKLKTAPVRPVVAARPAEYVCSEDLFY